MSTVVQDVPASSRVEITIDGELAGFVDYREDGGVYALPHTKVLPAFEGRGVGSQLVVATLEQLRDRGASVLPYCPFVPKVMRDHPELAALVPESERAAFGL